MKKLLAIILCTATLAVMLTGCEFSLTKTCKEPGCEETEIYQDGYCKYHYYLHAGEDVIKDMVNK